ncbi:uncharacterized protein HGUI_00569 [Hanseniaspora guilliermondii]|uniref:RRM domain-containing protein n=1 Tax=Hanseniaspora guilliermondii TaxID=56406 RepID=A0A1L0CJ47_9ASCO|nr:uncharacterized protein HGUI_00569 [Hanseniaspora guilliermondii]
MSKLKDNPSLKELEQGITNLKDSWHYQFKDQKYIHISNINERLTELDILKIFSQYGDIEDFYFLYDYKTKKRKNSAFLKYNLFESTVLAIDNLNNYKLLDKCMKVSHANSRLPDHEQFVVYHEAILDKLDEAIVYQGSMPNLPTQPKSKGKKVTVKDEDPMKNMSSEIIDL